MTSSSNGVSRRIVKGMRSEDMFDAPSLDYEDIDGSFCTQEYIQDRVRKNINDVRSIIQHPKALSRELDLWVYFHLRQMCMDINGLLVALTDECNETICPKMEIEKDEILCSAHKGNSECSPLNYSLHNVDKCTSILNDFKLFPSRTGVSASSTKEFRSMANRLYRIFYHAYDRHKETYVEFESETSLCKRLVSLCLSYGLMTDKQPIKDHINLNDMIIIDTKSKDDDEEDDY